jgi:hypothetical protein
MNEFVGTSPWVAITKDVARKRRGPVVAAISYVGVRASEVLPLREGDFLICDASERAIKQGVTSAKALASYLRIGVKVFSHEGLHSKVVATESFAWVGSANASRNSRDNLTEASVRIEGPACREAFRWALSLATEDTELSAQDVRLLAKLPVSWQARGGEPTRHKAVLGMPRQLEKLIILDLPNDAYAYMEKEADKRRLDLKKSLQIKDSRLDCFFWEDKRGRQNTLPAVGDWVVPVFKRGLGKPWQIVRISKLPHYRIFWFQELKTPLRQKIAELKNCIDGLDEDFEVRVVTDKHQILKIRKIYGI